MEKYSFKVEEDTRDYEWIRNPLAGNVVCKVKYSGNVVIGVYYGGKKVEALIFTAEEICERKNDRMRKLLEYFLGVKGWERYHT